MPDLLVIGVGVESRGSSPKQAADANLEKLSRLMRDLRAIGVNEGSIGAEELAATPIYAQVEGNEDRSNILGYRARQRLAIELRDLSRLQVVMTRLTADAYGDLSADFRLADQTSAAAEAQRAAIASAKREADNLASALGKRVGRLLLVANSSEGYRGWVDYGDTVMISGSREQPVELRPAPIEVESRVYADWSLIER
jgi:uncharacterized protein YggE